MIFPLLSHPGEHFSSPVSAPYTPPPVLREISPNTNTASFGGRIPRCQSQPNPGIPSISVPYSSLPCFAVPSFPPPFLALSATVGPMHTSSIAAKFSQPPAFDPAPFSQPRRFPPPYAHSLPKMALAYSRQTRMPPAAQQVATNPHNRQMQQFYLHKLFDLQSDVEFLPLIPSDPVATAIQMQESGMVNNGPVNQYAGHMSPAMGHENMYNGPKSRRYSGQFLRQHLFGGKRSEYAQYRSG